MSKNQNNNSWSGVAIVLFVIALVLTFVQSLFDKSPSSSSSYTPPRDNSFERRYVEERFKQEGYSRSESAQAADAILKFQQAQEARRNR